MLATFLQTANRQRGDVLTAYFRHLGAFGLFLLAIVDSSPIPGFGGPDILTVILAASHRNPWWEYSAVATLGSVIGALFTFRLARRAGSRWMHNKFGSGRVARLLRLFQRWQTSALAVSTAIPAPFPTSVFFAAAGVSEYPTSKYVAVVAICRGTRYSALALLGDYVGRRFIHVLRHPGQYWGWLLLLGLGLVALMAAGAFVSKRLERVYGSEKYAG